MSFGANRIAIGWMGTIVSALGLILLAGTGDAVGCCFWLVVFIAVTASGYDAKKKAAMLHQPGRVVYVQQPQAPVQQVVHHTYQPAPQAWKNQVQDVAKPQTPRAPEKSQAEWAMTARNLEMARDWEKAAQAYQKAGLFAEAGRIRQQHMEKDESQVKIKIDRIGDNIHDSVVMKDDETNL